MMMMIRDENCCHNVFLEDECTSCKKLRSDCHDLTTIPVNYLLYPAVNIRLTLSSIDRFRDQNLLDVLGRKKLNLILDLDNTLIHSKRTRKLTVNDQKHVVRDPSGLYKADEGSKLVKLRPGALDFLKKASSMFDLSIYTMGDRRYAHMIASLLATGSGQDWLSYFGKKIICREDCTKTGQKGLDVVLHDRRVVLVVDDRVDIWEESCRANVIQIAPYCFFEDKKAKTGVVAVAVADDDGATDVELKRVLGTLSLVHQIFYEDDNSDGGYVKRDVRRVLEKVRECEEQKKRKGEEAEPRKRQRETDARRFIEKFCAPVTKKCKRDCTQSVALHV